MLFVENKKMLNGLQNHEENELCFVKDEKKYYQYHDNAWTPQDIPTQSEITMDLYDMNKQLISQLPVMPEAEIRTVLEIIDKEFKESKYFMLLCRDINYYTLLENNADAADNFIDTVINCCNDIGTLMQVLLTEDKKAAEIWIKDPTEQVCAVAYLFNYDKGVIECQ